MRTKPKPLIQMPVFPEAMKPLLALLGDSMVSAIHGGGVSMEEGTVDLGPLPEDLQFPFFFVRWWCQFDEIFRNLNLILFDIEALHLKHVLLLGSPRQRFHLLVRTYFYEFYRAREVFNSGLKGLAGRGLIDPEDIRETRKVFHEAFESAIKIRNVMVHGLTQWPGHANSMLNHIGGAWELGYAVHEIESGQRVELSSIIKSVSDEYLPLLIDEANRLSFVLQAVLDECAKSTAA